MSLFQCEHCGCVENTALSCQGFQPEIFADCFDWHGIEERRGMRLCSACGPAFRSDGEHSGYAAWHGEFEQTYLEKGKWKTNRAGNLEHVDTGRTDFLKHAIEKPRP